ncbi:MAG: MmcQ/YjbR family DNA-binding protein [Candidatus Cloacimonetes bacterium]|nr:MmcQ/YjbR family DNA-binding protein [Candidatus Cloacimonadota bacterium]
MTDQLKQRFLMIELYCESLIGSKTEVQLDWNATKFTIHGKMYALIGFDSVKRPILTLRQEPSYVDFLQRQYNYIVPGYYMNKLHWISELLETEIQDDFIKELIMSSYVNVIKTLPKKYQNLTE